MNNKITFPELVEVVASKAGTTKRMSELFLKELFATITQSLIEGESVKVAGLGTFKLTAVSDRKSVNVNNGEEINIPGHNRLTFVPDKAMAEAINQPFAHFETIMLNDAVTDEQLQAIDADNDSSAPEAEAVEQEPEPEPIVVSEPEIENEPQAEAVEPVAEAEKVEEEVETEPEPEPESEPEPVAEEPEPQPEPESEPEPQPEPEPEPEPQPEPQPESEPEEEAEPEPFAEPVALATTANDEELQSLRIAHEREKRRLAHRMLAEGFVVGVITTLIVAWVSYRLYMMKYGPVLNKATQTEQVQPAAKPKAAPTKPATPAAEPTAKTTNAAATTPAPAPAAPAATPQAPAAPAAPVD